MGTTYQDQILTERKSRHLTIFSQCFSPCGNHLAVGNNYGTVLIYNLTAALSPNANENHWKPSFSFHVSSGPVYSIISTELFLICAGTGEIKAYKWIDILQKNSKVAWTLSIPSTDNQFSAPETNSIAHNSKVVENIDIENRLEKLEDGPVSPLYIDHAVVEAVNENCEAINRLEDFRKQLEIVVEEDEALVECKVEASTVMEDSGTVEVVDFEEYTPEEYILKVEHSDDVDVLGNEIMMRKRKVQLEENEVRQKKAKVQFETELYNFIPSMDDIIEFLRDERGVEEENLKKMQEEKDNVLYSGCGDKNVYSWDLESGTLKDTMRGHTDYVHCVSLFNTSNQLVSSSEDGSIRIWDCRGGREAQHVIQPYKNEECCRPHIGRWVSCVAVDPGDDWLVCGGGVSLSLWHLRSLSATCMYNIGNSSAQCILFHDDLIYSGGTHAQVSHLTMNGEVKTQVPCSPHSVFSLAINTSSENNKVLSVAGSSSQVDILTNFGYRAFSFQAVP